MESDKKKQYGNWIREVEHGSFTPLVFSSCGGMGQEASVVLKKLVDAIAAKHNKNYSHVIGWWWCYLAFSLARLAIRCIRGSRSIRCGPHHQAPVDLVLEESRMEQTKIIKFPNLLSILCMSLY